MTGWSHDPMDEARARADARHAMQTTLRHEQQDGHAEPAREGRFGRAPETTERPVTDPGTSIERDAGQIDVVCYEVDPDAVARAILERLVAGRTIRPLGGDLRRRG
jgi:hypothetical protein